MTSNRSAEQPDGADDSERPADSIGREHSPPAPMKPSREEREQSNGPEQIQRGEE